MHDLYTALVIGLVGSIHCIGMCGPIAVALPLGRKGIISKASGAMVYNLGRSITYGALGAIFGLLGRGIHLAGFQQWASILIGMVMIITVVFPFLFKGININSQWNSLFTGRLAGYFRNLFSNHSISSLFTIGLLNGLLPCGLVYVAVAGALNTNDALMGVLFMVVFGLGTLPVMMGVSLAGNFISIGLRRKINKIIPAFIIILGLLFILRGMSLGIPYISPKSQKLTPDKEVKTEGACCSKGDESFYQL